MTINLFYTETIHISPPNLVLTGQEAHHASRVMRYRKGDEIYVTDGEGSRYRGVIELISKEEVRVFIEEQWKMEKPIRSVTLLVGMIKKRERLEFAVEKAVELGASRIVVYTGDYSEKTGVRMDRLETTAISAMKQSLRLWRPDIFYCKSLKEALKQYQADQKFVADETVVDSDIGSSGFTSKESLLFVVGPEGGFSDSERGIMMNHNIVSISLGSFRLRTETAVVVIMSKLLMNDF